MSTFSIVNAAAVHARSADTPTHDGGGAGSLGGITNPTHFAVALKYDLDDMDAPVLIAKGQDFLAFKMREVAEEHGIPIVENPPVARALYANVDVDQEIP